jgi:CDP-diacylglycerol---serine O-phosphatidyltransferase
MMEPSSGPRAVRMSPAPVPPLPEPTTPVALRRPRRGVSVLPSLFTLANLFCGYACVVYAMRGEFETAAPLIGIAVVLDMLDGRIARMTGTATEFGVQFDSMADIVSFGMAPAILAFGWGLSSLGRLGWTAAFLFVAAAALRLARFNVQAGSTDKRYFIGMPSPAAAGIVAATVYAYPAGFSELHLAAPLVLLVVVPAALMVSTIRFRSFKSIDTNSGHSFRLLIFFALFIAALVTRPQEVLVVVAYTYLASPFIGGLVARLRRPDAGPVE